MTYQITYKEVLATKQPFSYIFYQDSDSYYCALNGKTNDVDFGGANSAGGASGIDAAAVMQAAFATVPTGGRFFFKDGVYLANSGLVPPNRAILVFESWSAELRANAVMNRLIDARNIDHLRIFGGTLNGNNNADVTVDCSRAVSGSYGHKITDSFVRGAKTVNVDMSNCEDSGLEGFCIIDGRVSDASGNVTQYGYRATGVSGAQTFGAALFGFHTKADIIWSGTQLRLFGTICAGGGTEGNLRLSNGAQIVLLSGVWFETTGTHNISVDGALCQFMEIDEPNFTAAQDNIYSALSVGISQLSVRGGFMVAGGAYKNINCGIDYLRLESTSVPQDLNWGVISAYESLKKTENKWFSNMYRRGSSTGTGALQTIPHGLLATPSNVTITPKASGTTVSERYADATNIYVTVTSGKDYNWFAEV
jgi:hypothetical protein